MTAIGLLGFGEVGQRFATDLRAADPGRTLAAFDLLLHQAAAGERMRQQACAVGVEMLTDAAGLAESCDLVFSAVTAEQTLAAARSLCGPALRDVWVVDLNSAAPQTKIECAALVAAQGGRYVEAAVMGAVAPRGIAVPMLLGGPEAGEAQKMLAALGLRTEVASQQLGVASAIKLCRSVIVKGLESLVVESFTAARHFGVEEQVLASLHDTWPQIDWERQGDYLFGRVIEHGRRRAEEMRASAEMIDQAGVGGVMAGGAAARLADAARLRERGAFVDPARTKAWRERADEVLRATARTVLEPGAEARPAKSPILRPKRG